MSQDKLKNTDTKATRRPKADDTDCLTPCETYDAEYTVNALKRKAEKIRRAQLDRTLKKLQGLSDEEKQSLETMTRDLVRELLRGPIERIEKDAQNEDGYVQLAHQLFRIKKPGPNE